MNCQAALGGKSLRYVARLGGKRARRLDEKILNRSGFDELLIELWERALEELASRPLPKLMTTDGEELVPIKETFTLLERSPAALTRLRDALLALPHATLEEREAHLETRIGFVRPNPPGSQLESTVLGHASVLNGELVMETMSRERAALFREQIERACGSLVVFASREERDQADLLKQMSARTSEPRALCQRAVPEEEAAENQRPLIRDHQNRERSALPKCLRDALVLRRRSSRARSGGEDGARSSIPLHLRACRDVRHARRSPCRASPPPASRRHARPSAPRGLPSARWRSPERRF